MQDNVSSLSINYYGGLSLYLKTSLTIRHEASRNSIGLRIGIPVVRMLRLDENFRRVVQIIPTFYYQLAYVPPTFCKILVLAHFTNDS